LDRVKDNVDLGTVLPGATAQPVPTPLGIESAGAPQAPAEASAGEASLWSTARRALRLVWRLVRGLAIAFALISALTVATLRWVDPPASAFMLRHSFILWRLGRNPPHYYHHWVPWDLLPAAAPLAVMAAEDQRFPVHHGFDAVEIRRALRDYVQGEGLRGASTITQQTAKNLFLWSERSWTRKGLEAWFTALIELLWPKKRILEVYLNIAQLGPNTYGVGAASERYFGHPASELTLQEASLLAGVLPAPSAYRLDRPSARLTQRAEWIADQTSRIGGRRLLERL